MHVSPTSSRTTEFVFFGGKGGVGKTTCAAAHAIGAAGRGRSVLVVSTDPAHSLGDALCVRLSARPRKVLSRLHAVELDAPDAFRRWVRANRRALGEILEHGTWLDSADVDALLGLSIPGIDELAGLLEIVRLAGGVRGSRASRYDTVVVDTAPTGHTLRLLAAPQTVGAVAHLFDALQQQHRMIREQLARVWRPEPADRLIALIAEQGRTTGELLHDRSRTSFTWITLPEALSLAESRDAVRALEAAGVKVPTVLVNRVLPAGPPCANCNPRRAEERRVIARVRATIGRNRDVRLIPAVPQEPRGSAALARLFSALPGSRKGKDRGEKSGALRHALRPVPSEDLAGTARLLFVGGKGGVGKTTVAAAAALALARATPAREVLLLSTDPAHSLSDVLKAPVGDLPLPVKGGPQNLRVREVDAPRALAARRAQIEAAVERIAGTLGTGSLVAVSSASVQEVLDLAPPGIDELFGLLEIVRGMSVPPVRGITVVDTAPTGHALRLLEMPSIAREWMQLLMRMLLKYRELVRPGPLGAELLELSRSIGSLQAMLKDQASTRFILVMRAAAVPRIETERFLQRLRRLELNVPMVVVNALTLRPGACTWCNAIAAAERRELARVQAICRRRPQRCAIIATPLAVPPPRGIPALGRWARTWIA